MADIKVKDLTDTQTINTDDEIMVLTNEAQNQVQNITVENLLTNILSSDNGNVLEQGTDGKLYVETPENITGELSDLSTTEKSSLVGAINEVYSDIATEVTNRVNAVSGEATTRQNADNNLQSQIDAITAASDVTDIVGTYAQLQAYDTTGLPDNSIIKVLQDESRENETTYYRWVITGGVGAWVLIGEEGPYYTISQADNKFATKATVGDLNNLATSDKSSVVNAMNELASVLDPTQTADYIKNSKGLLSGEISSNSDILSDIKSYAHSTFDLSKFTVVGSPTITDDGIASGFSTSNYLKNTNAVIGSTKPFKIVGGFKYISNFSGDNNAIFQLTGSDGWYNYMYIQSNSNGQSLRFRVQVDDGNNTHQNLIINHSFVAGSYYLFVVGWTGIQYYLELYKDGVYIGNTTYSSTYPLLNINTSALNIGFDNHSNYYCKELIDLKQFSITVDGVEVFSGNKTGIDTIKPDDYTVVGSPTISDDGVASGFTNTSYLSAPSTLSLSVSNSAVIRLKFKLNGNQASDNAGSLYAIYGTPYNLSTPVISANSTRIDLYSGITSSQTNFYTCEVGKWYILEEVFTSTTKTTNIYDINNNLLKTQNFALTQTLNLTDIIIRLCGNPNTNRGLTAGVIDLNAFKVYLDGNLVYQPCLKIPYTESKTGSKIVDAVYRDRVNDMAEQFGYAPYYTLSDNDFTLPQGEIYGYLEKRARDIAHPVAQPFYRFSDEINEDEVRLEGAEVDKGLYLAIEQDPYLSALCTAGSTADKICLPDFRNRVIYGEVASGYVEPELPNITGTLRTVGANNAGLYLGDSTGAFANPSNSVSGQVAYDPSGTTYRNANFDASLSSSIYKDGGTVKTAGVKARWLCRWK